MEFPEVGECISYCECDTPYECNLSLRHAKNIFREHPRNYIVLASAPHIWTMYNIGFTPTKSKGVRNNKCWFAGSRIACIAYPGPIEPRHFSSGIEIFDNAGMAVAKYNNAPSFIKILALEERIARLEQFIEQHLYYSPGGGGANTANSDWAKRLSGIKE